MATQPRKPRKQSGFSVTIDVERSKWLIDHSYRMYQERRGIYAYHNATTGPQNQNMPGSTTMLETGPLAANNAYVQVQDGLYDKRIVLPDHVEKKSPEHVNWTFFSTLTDRRQVSMEVYFAHRKLYAQYPEIYSSDVRKMDSLTLGNILIKYRIGCPRQSAEYWIKCAKTLYDEFNWNPLNFVEKCENSVEKIQEWKSEKKKKSPGGKIDPLPGYGPKITSLFTLYMAELGLIEMPKDSFPVDMHVQRSFFQVGAAYGDEGFVFNEEMEDRLRRLICEYANEKGYDKIALSHAFWQRGRVLCTNCYRRNSVPLLCPLYNECAGPAETKRYFSHGVWDLPIRFMRKGGEGKLLLHPGGHIQVEEKILQKDGAGRIVVDDKGKVVHKTVSRIAYQHGIFTF